MPKRKRIRLPPGAYGQGHVFSVTIATSERFPWFKLHDELSEKAIRLLHGMAKEREALLFAWCLMPDHIHLLLQDKLVPDFIRIFKGRLTPDARKLGSGQGLWQRSFYDHALRKEESLRDVALYIWENPVRAGIVDKASAYPWSGSLVWTDWRDFR